MNGWLMWKDGQPHGQGPAKTKETLLIMYDMMSLRGLDACEEWLRAKGVTPLLTTIAQSSPDERHGYGPLVGDAFDADLLEWSGCNKDPFRALHSTVHFLQARRAALCTQDELGAFKHWLYFPTKDGRRRTTYARLTAQVQGALTRLTVRIVPVRYTVAPVDTAPA